jgi:hemoglobin-like flavoprotein
MFGFGKEFPIGCEEVYKTEQFRRHTISVVSTINTAISMLSQSSLDDLLIVLKDLGVKHAEYEAKKEHYEVVGQALVLTLEKELSAKGQWNDDVKAAWVDVYQLIQDTMLQGAAEYFENNDADATTNKGGDGNPCIDIVKKSWAQVKEKVVDHERVIGGLLFRRYVVRECSVCSILSLLGKYIIISTTSSVDFLRLHFIRASPPFSHD